MNQLFKGLWAETSCISPGLFSNLFKCIIHRRWSRGSLLAWSLHQSLIHSLIHLHVIALLQKKSQRTALTNKRLWFRNRMLHFHVTSAVSEKNFSCTDYWILVSYCITTAAISWTPLLNVAFELVIIDCGILWIHFNCNVWSPEAAAYWTSVDIPLPQSDSFLFNSVKVVKIILFWQYFIYIYICTYHPVPGLSWSHVMF